MKINFHRYGLDGIWWVSHPNVSIEKRNEICQKIEKYFPEAIIDQDTGENGSFGSLLHNNSHFVWVKFLNPEDEAFFITLCSANRFDTEE